MLNFGDKLKNMTPYVAAHDDYSIVLNANESFVPIVSPLKVEMLSRCAQLDFNRYPDPSATMLCRCFANYYEVDPELCTAGNGSDELIGVLYGSLLSAGDKVMTLEWDFSMYQFYSTIYQCEHVVVAKEPDLTVDMHKVIARAKAEQPQMIIFSNPCNPTSLGMRREDIILLLESVSALVVVDEAYMDFYDQSVLDLVGQYDNLVVLKTCSKALALAALRLGFAVAARPITRLLQTGKSPYNVNAISQAMGEVIFDYPELIDSAIGEIKASKRMLDRGLRALAAKTAAIVRIMPSDTNFVFMEVVDADGWYRALQDEGILVRKMGTFLRISAGTMMENDSVLEALAAIIAEEG